MPASTTKLQTPARRAFTLIEVIIVIMVIVLFAGMIVPRFFGLNKRAEQLVVDRVADIIGAFSYRDSLASGKAAIEYEHTTRRLMLLELEADPNSPDDPPVWKVDNLAPVVEIPDGIVLRAFEDGDQFAEGSFSILARSDGTRPKIEIKVLGEDLTATILLDPWAQGPHIISDELGFGVDLPDAIDLDSTGQDREPW
jgi:prepilin-type N-terminal cleavage/methylation domain-containing protein